MISAELISNMLHRTVAAVLDPTFLLDKNQWISSFGLRKKMRESMYYFTLSQIRL